MFLLHAALWPAQKHLPYQDQGTQYSCHYKQPGGHQPGTGVPREQQPQPQLRAWGNSPSKHLQQEERSGKNEQHLDCKTMPLQSTPYFRGLQAGLLTQVQQSRNTRCLLPSGITPELISPVIRAGSQHSGAGSLMQTNGGWPWKEPVRVWGLLAQALHHAKEYKVALEAK